MHLSMQVTVSRFGQPLLQQNVAPKASLLGQLGDMRAPPICYIFVLPERESALW